MNYLSLCSGIEAATVAWHPLGWHCVGVAEIEPFPCAVLKHHYPNVPNLGDLTKYETWPLEKLRAQLADGAIVGGTPCQSFSVAGLRGGMDDDRGNLALIYLRIVNTLRPRWFIWENVPGVLSSGEPGGADLAAFFGGVEKIGYGYAWRTLDAQYFDLAQQRERVFVVGYRGDWRRPAAALFEPYGLRRHIAPRRRPRARPSGATANGPGVCYERAGCLPASYGGYSGNGGFHSSGVTPGHLIPDISRTLNAGGVSRQDYDTQTFVLDVCAPLTRRHFADRGAADESKLVACFAPVQITSPHNRSLADPHVAMTLPADSHAPCLCFRGAGQERFTAKDLAPCLTTTDGGGTIPTLVMTFSDRFRGPDADRDYGRPPAVHFDIANTLDASKPPFLAYGFQSRVARNGRGDMGDVVHALTQEAGSDGRGDSAPCIAYRIHGTDERVRSAATATETATALRARVSGGQENSTTTAIAYEYRVRRLTPLEFERLQGFPEHYTLIEWGDKKRKGIDYDEEFAYLCARGIPPDRAAILAHTPDGPRYAAIGNSMAVPVMRWLGERLQLVDAIP